MKRTLSLVATIAFLLAVSCVFALAFEYTSVSVEIPFSVETGGTAVIITENNAPAPDEAEIYAADGETGCFHVHIDRPGEYKYLVKMKPEEDNTVKDDTVFEVEVFITDDDGNLTPTVIAYKDEYKYAGLTENVVTTPETTLVQERKLSFILSSTYKKEHNLNPDGTPVDEDGKGRNPRTGDDTQMEYNFLIAMIASAGLLGLSIVYLDDSLKMVKAYRGMGQ